METQVNQMTVEEIASTLSTLTSYQVDRYAEFLPFLGQGCRSTFALNDEYVLKIAPDGRMYDHDDCRCYDDAYLCTSCETTAQRDYCYDPHSLDEIECQCEPDQSDYWYGQNVAEATMWQQIKDDENARRYFVPVVASDPDGKWLIAERVRGLDYGDYNTIPDSFFDAVYQYGIKDIKRDNLGKRADGSFVVLDYGISSVWEELNDTVY